MVIGFVLIVQAIFCILMAILNGVYYSEDSVKRYTYAYID